MTDSDRSRRKINTVDGYDHLIRQTSRTQRHVADLNPTQLERKRAIDREAQRSFRKRTKLQIEELEKRVSELASQHLAKQLEAVTEERDTLTVANQCLQNRIESIETTLKDILKPLPLFELHGNPGQANTKIRREQSIFSSSPNSRSSVPKANCLPTELKQQTPGSGPTTSSLLQIEHGSLDLLHRPFLFTDTHPLSTELETLESTSLNGGLFEPIGNQSEESHPNIDSWISSMSVFESNFPEQSIPWVCPPISPHQALPLNSIPTCTVDIMWSDFIASRNTFKTAKEKRRVVSGSEGEQSEDMSYPTLSRLLNPTTVASHPVGQLLTSILDMYCRPSAIPEQVAVLFKMYRLMKWQMAPTAENYNSLPDWLMPTTCQILTPHPAWMDQVVWPKARNFLIQAQESYNFQDFSDTFSGALRINWPYKYADVFLVQAVELRDDDNKMADPVLINPVFEQHIMDLKNWTITPKVSEIYPDLAALCQI